LEFVFLLSTLKRIFTKTLQKKKREGLVETTLNKEQLAEKLSDPDFKSWLLEARSNYAPWFLDALDEGNHLILTVVWHDFKKAINR